MNKNSGTLITFEGIDYSGKSVQSRRLQAWLEEKGVPCILLRDPGATRISEKIRGLLLDNDHHEMAHWTELLLYEAARAQMVQETILPALNNGKIVVCDRFYDSTTAYQGYGRGLDLDVVERANSIGACGLVPKLTLLIDLDVDTAEQRRLHAKQTADRLEAAGLAFQNDVRNGYLEIARRDPDRVKVVNGNDAIEAIADTVLGIVNKLI